MPKPSKPALAILSDGTKIEIPADQVSRVLYGLTNIQQTALCPALNVIKIQTQDGGCLWQNNR